MSADNSNPIPDQTPEHDAAQWLARRDRGLTAVEQDDNFQWLRESSRNPVVIAQQEAALKRMMRLRDWKPAESSEPNPDLFAPPRRRRRWLIPVGLAAAAALALGLTGWWRLALRSDGEGHPKTYLVVNERIALSDGSIVELREGSRISTEFTASERRVHLLGEEAHFKIAKNPARPFLVETGGVVVRAVGTAFDVRLDGVSVDVLVTEGQVRLEQPLAAGRASAMAKNPIVSAGQRATVSRSAMAGPPSVARLTPAEIEEALAWQNPRLQFYETRLADAVAEFNRHNRRQLLLGETGLDSIPIGGTFRVDNVDGFARLLEVTLGLRAEERNSREIVLRRAR